MYEYILVEVFNIFYNAQHNTSYTNLYYIIYKICNSPFYTTTDIHKKYE